jgi:DNA primase
MWGLSLETGEGKYLPGFMEGAYNFPAVKRSRSLILTDSILKALYLYQCGFTDVVALWGKGHSAHGLTQDHLRLFQRYGTKQVVLTFEGEEAAKKLREEEIGVSFVALPEFPAESKVIEEALRQAQGKNPVAAEVL